MRRFIFSPLLVVFMNLLFAEDKVHPWTPTSGPLDGTVHAIETVGDSTVIVAGNYGFCISSDNGHHWETGELIDNYSSVKGLCKTNKSIFASAGNLLYRSRDNGKTWLRLRPAAQGFTVKKNIIMAVYCDLFIPTGIGFLNQSADDGESWDRAPLPEKMAKYQYQFGLVCNDKFLFAFSSAKDQASILFRSPDNGQTWSDALSYPSGGSKKLIVNGNTLFTDGLVENLGNRPGIFRSDDDGATWSYIGLEGLLVDVKNHKGSLFLGVLTESKQSSGIYRSDDSGITWKLANSSLVSTNVVAMAVNANCLFVGLENMGISYSDSKGLHWINTLANWPYPVTVRSMVLKGDEIFAICERSIIWPWYSGFSYGLFYSQDNGENWEFLNEKNGLPGVVTCMTYDAKNSKLYLGAGGKVYYIDSEKKTWNPLDNKGLGGLIWSIGILNNVVYAGVDHQGLFRFAGVGKGWEIVLKNNHKAPPPCQFLRYASGPGVLYVLLASEPAEAPPGMGCGSELFCSLDNGRTWKGLGMELEKRAAKEIATYKNYVFLCTSEGLLRSNNNGKYWAKLLPENTDVTSIFSNDKILIAGTSAGELYASWNGGDTWVLINHELPGYPIHAIAANDKYIFSGLKSINSSCSPTSQIKGPVVWKNVRKIIDENLNGFPF